jgi:hypothetical protein
MTVDPAGFQQELVDIAVIQQALVKREQSLFESNYRTFDQERASNGHPQFVFVDKRAQAVELLRLRIAPCYVLDLSEHASEKTGPLQEIRKAVGLEVA